MGKNAYFDFKTFSVHFSDNVFPVGTDAALLGAWTCLNYTPTHSPIKALDIGCGSGILSLFIARKFNALCTAIDFNSEAIKQCKANAIRNALQDKITAEAIDFNGFGQINSPNSFDIIVCNPPFFEGEKLAESARQKARHTANHFVPSEFMNVCAKLLNAEGCLNVVIPIDQLSTYSYLAKQNGLYIIQKAFVKGLINKPIKRALISFSKTQPTYTKTELIVIEKERKQYTDKAHRLFQPYYLNL